MSEAVTLSIVSLIGTTILGGFTFVVNVYRIRANAELQKLKDAVCDQQGEINKLKDANVTLTKNNRALWSYLVSNIEHMWRKNVKPLPLPDELASDPELSRLVMLQPQKARRAKRKVKA